MPRYFLDATALPPSLPPFLPPTTSLVTHSICEVFLARQPNSKTFISKGQVKPDLDDLSALFYPYLGGNMNFICWVKC